jgi:hypothetical protein
MQKLMITRKRSVIAIVRGQHFAKAPINRGKFFLLIIRYARAICDLLSAQWRSRRTYRITSALACYRASRPFSIYLTLSLSLSLSLSLCMCARVCACAWVPLIPRIIPCSGSSRSRRRIKCTTRTYRMPPLTMTFRPRYRGLRNAKNLFIDSCGVTREEARVSPLRSSLRPGPRIIS